MSQWSSQFDSDPRDPRDTGDPRDKGDPRDELLDAYLDEQLSGARLARFEALLRDQPMLQREIDRQRQLDQSLKRLFTPPAPQNGQHPGRVETQPRRPLLSVRRALAVAAAIAILIGGPVIGAGAWQNWFVPQPKVAITGWVRPLDVAYRGEVAAGFKVDWTYRNQDELASLFDARLQEPMKMRELPSDITALGFGDVGGVSPRTLGFYAKVGNQPVLVFADRLERDRDQTSIDPTLNIFRRTVGDLVLYEVTPLPSPHLLDLFYETAPASQSTPFMLSRPAAL